MNDATVPEPTWETMNDADKLELLKAEAQNGDNTYRSRLFGPGRTLGELESMTATRFYAVLSERLRLRAREYQKWFRARGLLTANPEIGEDVALLFNNLSGISRNRTYDHLLVAPHSVREGLVAQIHQEIAHHQAGRPAAIRIKANSVVDEAVIDALYDAGYTLHPLDEPDEWGDLASFRDAAGSS